MYSVLGRYYGILKYGVLIRAALAVERPSLALYSPDCKFTSCYIEPVPIPWHWVRFLPLYHLFYGTAASLQLRSNRIHISPRIENDYTAASSQIIGSRFNPPYQVKAFVPFSKINAVTSFESVEVILSAQIVWRVS